MDDVRTTTSGLGETLGHDEPWLRIDSVTHSFGTEASRGLVLSDLSITVSRGELVALVGPSGCGKSTLLDIIAGLIRPDQGRVCIADKDVTGEPGHVSYMLQDDVLLPWRNVLDNVVLGRELVRRAGRVDRAYGRSRAGMLMSQFGLEGFEDYYPSALSGGMRQRVAFMRTVLCDREVLLLDEPFRGLDVLTKHQLHEWLANLQREFSLTILFVTHDPDEAVFLADRTYVLSPRPASARDEIEIGLPRPRHRQVVGSPEFAELERRILELLWRQGHGDDAA